ncbi:MAG: hypothetical protein AAGG01_03505 [Planctomycetota bacterium]
MPVSREVLIERSRPRSLAADLVTIVCFGVCVLVPGWATIGSGVDRAKEAAKVENRRAERPPSMPTDLTALEAFPRRFDAGVVDAFLGRRELMRRGARAKLDLFHSAIGPRWRFGEDRWLFATDHDAFPVTVGLAPLAEDELERWRVTIDERRDWLAEQGIEYLLALVPYKGAVYPDRLPAGLEKRGPDHREQMLSYLRERSSVRTVDLGPTLREAAASDLSDRHAYSPHGVHWTDYGGFAAYREILAALPDVFPGVEPLELSDFDLVGDQVQTDSWDHRIALDGVLVQTEAALMPRTRGFRRVRAPEGSTKRDVTRVGPLEGPRVMVVHDSFGPKVSRLLAMHASRLDSRWRPYLEAHLVTEHRPDVVIEVYSELSLSTRKPIRLSGVQPAAAFAAFDEADEVTSLMETSAPSLVPPYDQAILSPGVGSDGPSTGAAPRSWRLNAESRAALVRIDLPIQMASTDELAVLLKLDARSGGTLGVYDGPKPQGIPEISQLSPVLFAEGPSHHVVPLNPWQFAAGPRKSIWLAFPEGTDLTILDVVVRRVARRRSAADEAG